MKARARAGLATNPGLDPEKAVNEDSAGVFQTHFGDLAVVCDGMGGHLGGKAASETALRTVAEIFRAAPPDARPRELLQDAIIEANRRVFSLSPETARSRAGSTLVAVLVHDDGTEVAHAGDSRCYRIRDGQIFQVTEDHSVVQGYVAEGLLSPHAASAHPDAHRITRALGIARTLEVAMIPSPLSHQASDLFILCSDGLSDLVPPNVMLRIATSYEPEQGAEALVSEALARGGHDNITVVVLKILVAAKKPSTQLTTTVSGLAPTWVEPPREAPSQRTELVIPKLAPLPQHLGESDPGSGRLRLGLGLGLAVLGVVLLALVLYLKLRPSESRIPADWADKPASSTRPP